jgi:hypothetical protein
MAIATIKSCHGEVLKSFDELTPEKLEENLARAATNSVDVAATHRVPRRAEKGS